MKIVDVLKQTSEMLALGEEINILNTATEEKESEILNNKEISTLFNLFRYSIQELCTNYMPIATSVIVEITNRKYEVSNLTNYIKVQSVYKNEEPVNYKVLNRAIVVEADGEYTIQYSTYPTINSIFDEIDYLSNLSPDVLVFSLAAYYTLSRGRFDEFEIFYEQYKAKAESLKELKCFSLPQRRWEWEQKNELN